MGDIDTEKVLVSNKISFGEKYYKYFICYFCNSNKVKPLNIILAKTSTYVKSCDSQTKWIYFFIEDNDLLKKYSTIWYYKKEFLKTKIKSHGDEVTNFYDKNIPKVGSNHICLTVITLDSALKKNDKYYPQVFLKECEYIERKVIRHINDNLRDFSSDDDETDEE